MPEIIAAIVILSVPLILILSRRDIAFVVAKNIWRELNEDGLDRHAQQIASRSGKRDYYN